MLYTMTQEQLAHTLFPLGGYAKPEARKLAEDRGLVNAGKARQPGHLLCAGRRLCRRSSSCYTGKKAAAGQLCRRGRATSSGSTSGIIHYTIGQHRGLGLGHERAVPTFVKFVRRTTRSSSAVGGAVPPGRGGGGCELDLAGKRRTAPIRCCAKVRYRQTEQPATVTPRPDGGADILFDEPQRAITPGQAAVFYDGDVVLGGGVLE